MVLLACLLWSIPLVEHFAFNCRSIFNLKLHYAPRVLICFLYPNELSGAGQCYLFLDTYIQFLDTGAIYETLESSGNIGNFLLILKVIEPLSTFIFFGLVVYDFYLLITLDLVFGQK